MTNNSSNKARCAWVPLANELYVHYHDQEWGVPQYEDQGIFEHLTLETAQAGLSWLTILKKRENYRQAFAGFDPKKIAIFTPKDIDTLLENEGIIRNRQKITSAVSNAQKFLNIQQEFGSFSAYQWHFVGGAPLQNAWPTIAQIPTMSAEANAFSKDLKQRGFRFIGPTTIYAHMQGVGMVNDHTTDCFRYEEVLAMAS